MFIKICVYEKTRLSDQLYYNNYTRVSSFHSMRVEADTSDYSVSNACGKPLSFNVFNVFSVRGL